MCFSELGEPDELVPAPVDLRLDVLDDGLPPLLLEVLEPSLGSDPVGDRLLLGLAVGDPGALCGQGVLAVDDLEQRPHAGLDREAGDVDRLVGREPPSPGTGEIALMKLGPSAANPLDAFVTVSLQLWGRPVRRRGCCGRP